MLFKWMLYITPFFLSTFFLYNSCLAQEQKPNKVIVFDSGGVITQTDKKMLSFLIAQMLGISPCQAENALLERKEKSSQGIDEEDFWIQYAQNKKIKLPTDWKKHLDEAKKQSLRDVPGMVELVKNLQKQGYKTALLANITGNQALIKQDLGHYELFNPALFSYKIGVYKPNRKAFDILLNELKVPPQNVIFIDDKEINVEGAKKAGIDGILFLNAQQIVMELNKRGILINSN